MFENFGCNFKTTVYNFQTIARNVKTTLGKFKTIVYKYKAVVCNVKTMLGKFKTIVYKFKTTSYK